jgi:integrase
MAPRIKDARLENRTQRAKLKIQRKPYSKEVAPGIRLGYRRNKGAGTWSVLCADGVGGSWMKRIALADDLEDADGEIVMDFWQAGDKAKQLARAADGAAPADKPLSVREALEAYQFHLAAAGRNTARVKGLLKLLPRALADKPVALVTEEDVSGFRGSLADGRKNSSVKRIMTPFNAALTAAARKGKIANRAWKNLEALEDDTEARNVILSDHKVHAIVGASYEQEYEWGLMVDVLGETGTRISQAQRLDVLDLLAGDRLAMPVSRKGKGKKAVQKRPVPITPALAARLRAHAAGRRGTLLVDGDGRPWATGCQQDRFAVAVRAAGLDPAEVTSYALRHSSIVRQLLANVPIRVVASNHDTSVEMIEAHYSAYITDHSDALTRKALPAEPLRAANDNSRVAMTG